MPPVSHARPVLAASPLPLSSVTPMMVPREDLASSMPLLHRAVSTLFDHFLSTTQQAESDFPSSSTPLSGNLLPEHSKQQQPGASPFAHSNLLEQRQLHALAPRQNAVYAIPLSYDFSGPSAGTVVGIVLGIVGGIILIVVLFWAAFSVGPGGGGDELVVVANTDASHSDYLRSRRSRRRRSSKYEMRQHRSRSRSHSPPPPPRRPRTERIIVQETRRTESRPPPIQINVDSPLSPARSHRVPNDDVVEVIEEQSEISSSIPPPRRKSKRTSGSYRVVDPDAYAGGNYAPRDVYDDRRRSKR